MARQDKEQESNSATEEVRRGVGLLKLGDEDAESRSPSTASTSISPDSSFFPSATDTKNGDIMKEEEGDGDYDGGIFLEESTGTEAAAATTGGFPASFNQSPEPVSQKPLSATAAASALAASAPTTHPPPAAHPGVEDHNYHLLCQIQEDKVSDDDELQSDISENSVEGNDLKKDSQIPNTSSDPNLVLHPSIEQRGVLASPPVSEKANISPTISSTLLSQSHVPPPAIANNGNSLLKSKAANNAPYFVPQFYSSRIVYWISKQPLVQKFAKDGNDIYVVATWMGFFALLNVTCANYVLTPMRDAVALQVGVANIPKLTLASSVLAFFSSVPIGWLFEAPDPSRRKVWKSMGLTRGATQGTSLALFYRFFAISVLSYAVGFTLVDWYNNGGGSQLMGRLLSSFNSSSTTGTTSSRQLKDDTASFSTIVFNEWVPFIWSQLGFGMYIAFFLVVHLMKLHSISLVWGVTTEAMEYEDVARKHHKDRAGNMDDGDDTDYTVKQPPIKTRLQRLAFVGFGGTLGGLWGSILASSMANVLKLSGLLVLSALLLEISAELSIELGRIMQKHWEEQQIFRSCQDLTKLDASMQRSTSMGSMKRIASGNSLYRVASANSMTASKSMGSLDGLDKVSQQQQEASPSPPEDDNTFTQRLLRGITTILRSRLLMAIFTYNALFASTSVLLSFQRAELVANRNSAAGAEDDSSSIRNDTAFLANINMASSMAVFAMQASGIGAVIAQSVGSRGSLALMPAIRFLAVVGLAWWHRASSGQPPNLILFLMLDECTRVVNLAIAKPVRESLWRGLSNEARYEAKPIVDTLANRWGAGSASFCVSIISKILLWWGMETGEIFGLSPVLFLCLIVAAWWAMVSVDLGHIRARIDLELKKHQ